MARLIIGHTTNNSCKIWVRGDKKNPVAFLTVSRRNSRNNRPINKTKILEEQFGYTGIFEIGRLQPNTNYSCKVEFGEDQNEPPATRMQFGHTDGKFKTFPNSRNRNLTFLFGSCNLHSLGIFQNPDKAFRTLINVADQESVDFMLHCGDQIYYDIPGVFKGPDFEEYRKKYLDAWGDSRPTRKFLTQLPQYMILDDHELENDFSSDMKGAGQIKKHGLRVYREFQHIHNPQTYGNHPLYYNFSHGAVKFFCLDTRSERVKKAKNEEGDRVRTFMIDDEQLRIFKQWLIRNRNSVKFVVSSVPFVGHVEHGSDKWCSDPYAEQREEIIKYILDNNITKTTFLTGDMHNSYRAKMTVQSESGSVVINELMSSPINQATKSSLGIYLSGKTITRGTGSHQFSYKSEIRRSEFYNEHSNAMLVRVNGNTVNYEVFRTKKNRRNEIEGEFNLTE